MKKHYIISIFFICFSAYCQEFGTSPLKVTGVFDKYAKPVYRVWQRQPKKDDVIMKFERTPKGIDEALKIVKQLLSQNKLDFTNPDIYKSYKIPDITKATPITLYNLVQTGNAQIIQAWFGPDSSTLFLNITKNSYEVNVVRAYKTE